MSVTGTTDVSGLAGLNGVRFLPRVVTCVSLGLVGSAGWGVIDTPGGTCSLLQLDTSVPLALRSFVLQLDCSVPLALFGLQLDCSVSCGTLLTSWLRGFAGPCAAHCCLALLCGACFPTSGALPQCSVPPIFVSQGGLHFIPGH